MAYTSLVNDKPAASDNGLDFADYTRENLMAMRDAVAMGAMENWNYSKTDGTGTAEQPQYVFYKNGTNWIRGTLTWGTSGGADGNVTVALWEYSSTSGSSYDTIGTQTMAYDTSGNLETITWS